MNIVLENVDSMSAINSTEWNSLTGTNPSLAHEYFHALENSKSVCPETGWQPLYLLARENGNLLGAMPLFFKSHSYGEFVFDHDWADAYERNGIAYYPKLVTSVPFTPITGARIFSPSLAIRKLLTTAALDLAQRAGVSSLHILFPEELLARELADQGFMLRQSVQFHWRRLGINNFSEFLATMRHEKRKKIRKERKRLADLSITYEQIRGNDATAEDWLFFYKCYLHTHQIYQSPISLRFEFFQQISQTMPEKLLLLFASRNGERIAGAFFLLDSQNLYGRSWGALEYIPGLHFELCYYQAIDFCLENKIDIFEGGAQGEHKLARGFSPSTTWSAHWLAHPVFANAVKSYLKQEAGSIAHYVEELGSSSPFKRNPNNQS